MQYIDDNTVLLLHCDGDEGSTTFTDSSPNGQIVTAENGAVITTSNYKFGTGGLNFDYTNSTDGGYLKTTDSSDFNFGSGDFTVDLWCYFDNDSADNPMLLTLWEWNDDTGTIDSGWYLRIIGNQLAFRYSADGTTGSTTLLSDTVLTSGVLYHFATVRSGDEIALFVDGVKQTTTLDVTGVSFHASSLPLTVGTSYSTTHDTISSSLDGWMDEIRISNVARWYEDFTPPTEPYMAEPLPSVTAKSVVVNIDTNWGGAVDGDRDYCGVRSIDFYKDGVLLPLTAADFTAYATDEYDTVYLAEFAFDTSLSKTGDWIDNAWLSLDSGDGQKVLIVAFNTPQEFDEIVINNAMLSPAEWDTALGTGAGIKDVKIYTSFEAVTDTTYPFDGKNSDLIFDGEIPKHVVADEVDGYTPSLVIPEKPTITAKSVIVDALDNWGHAENIAVTLIDFYKDGVSLGLTTADFTAYATSTYDNVNISVDNTFDTTAPVTGLWGLSSWIAEAYITASQRLIVVFNTEQEFDSVVINNAIHTNGAHTEAGIKNTKITVSDNDYSDIAYNAEIPSDRVIFEGEIPEHIAEDVIDNYYVPVVIPESTGSVTAKSVVIDIADSWDAANSMGLNLVDFFYNGASLALTPTDFTAYSTTILDNADVDVNHPFDTDTPTVGHWAEIGWISEGVTPASTNQRLIVVFNTEQTFDTVCINNVVHSGGVLTERGINNVKITASEDAITDTTYDAVISSSTVLYDGVVPEHIKEDVADNYWIFLEISEPAVVSPGHTVLLLHCDGANGSVFFTDFSPRGHTVTAHDGAYVDTSDKKFGTGALNPVRVDASNSGRLTIPTHDDFNFGANDFTIDFWTKVDNGVDSCDFVTKMDYDGVTADNFSFQLRSHGGKLRFGYSLPDATTDFFSSTNDIPLSTFTHIAVVRGGDNLYMFLDGVLDSTHDVTGVSLLALTHDVQIGASYMTQNGGEVSGGLDGWMDEIRISNIARWTVDFTPPTEASPDYIFWTPDEMVSPSLWLDASDSSTITTDVGVSEWADKSGNGNHAVQATGSSQPTIHTTQQNGLDVFHFDNSFIVHPFSSGSPEISIFIVLSADVQTGYVGVFFTKGGDTTDETMVLARTGTDSWGTYSENGDEYASSISGTGYEIIEMVREQDGTGTFFTNGVDDGTFSGSGGQSDGDGGYVGGLATQAFSGTIAEIVVTKAQLTTDERQQTEGYLAWKWGLEDNLPADHLYKDAPPVVIFVPDPELPILPRSTFLDQYYSFSFGSWVQQNYGDVPPLMSLLNQYYFDAYEVKRYLHMNYGNAQTAIAVLNQSYEASQDLKSSLTAVFDIFGVSNSSFMEFAYSLKSLNAVEAALHCVYNLQDAGGYVSSTHEVYVRGNKTAFVGYNIECSIDRHCIIADITLAREEDWISINYLDEIQIVDDATTYELQVFEINKSISLNSKSYTITAGSPSITLDTPYSSTVDDTFVLSMASDTARRLALLAGISALWEIPADGLLDSDTLDLVGMAPIEAIKKIVGDIGGVTLSLPDGSLTFTPRRAEDSDKLHLSVPDYYLTSGENFISTETTNVKNTGYNSYSVSSSSSESKDYTLEHEEVSETETIIRAYQSYWEDEDLSLTTSEVSNIVGIERLSDVIDERVCEVVEVVEGSGNVSKPVNVLLDYDYQSSANLGIVNVSEDGNFTTAVDEESTVKITYYSRYRQWRVSHTGNLNVQFILETQ